MPKKDGASKRLEVAISGAQYIKPWFVTNDGGKTARLEYFGLLNFPPSNVLKDAQIKPAALMHLDAGNYLDQPILAAFKTFGLEHRYLGHWRILLTYLASVHFAGRRAPGRRRKWTDLDLLFLLADFADKKKRHPNKFDADICGYIARDRGINKETVRRKLQDARNPARNSALAAAVETLTLKQKDEASAKHVAWTETDEQKARAECLQEVLTNADKLGLSKLSEKTPRISLKYSVRRN